MVKNMNNKEVLKEMLNREVNAVNNLSKVLDFDKIDKAVEKIANCKGNVIFAGCGSSSTAAFRAANIYNFLYIPSIAINVMNALHGEYGMIREGDIFIPISKSGNTEELVQSIPIAKKLGAYIIGLTENDNSYIAENSDIAITFNSLKELDDKDMVATSSTTCSSIILDIIGGAVMKKNNITDKDFKLIHPNGAVGEMLKD
ncbi:SIS domain-containing protein [Anaerofustis stercorihominis]|uniref:SIS domain-containing protein n=2 Tax=Anaerofustis stercorihominis TaxID=214853 RepID=A0A3E3DX78_9FIRM|nr:SIS domain-containing protein [Anaerofustis stercorihominis]